MRLERDREGREEPQHPDLHRMLEHVTAVSCDKGTYRRLLHVRVGLVVQEVRPDLHCERAEQASARHSDAHARVSGGGAAYMADANIAKNGTPDIARAGGGRRRRR